MIKFLLPLLVLAACSTELSGNDFVKSGVSSTQRMSDTQSCTDYANRAPVATVSGPEGVAERNQQRDELFSQCMMGRGYRRL